MNTFWCEIQKTTIESCPLTGDVYCPDKDKADTCPYKVLKDSNHNK